MILRSFKHGQINPDFGGRILLSFFLNVHICVYSIRMEIPWVQHCLGRLPNSAVDPAWVVAAAAVAAAAQEGPVTHVRDCQRLL